MTLVVEYADFARAVQLVGGDRPCVFFKRIGDSVHLTFVNPASGVQVVSFFVGSEADVTPELQAAGFTTMRGTWVTEASLEHLAQLTSETYIAGIAYETRRGPGIWMDAFPTPPSEGTVLRAMSDEFVSEGLIDPDEFEAFIRDARPQVRILEPIDVERFLKQKPKP